MHRGTGETPGHDPLIPILFEEVSSAEVTSAGLAEKGGRHESLRGCGGELGRFTRSTCVTQS